MMKRQTYFDSHAPSVADIKRKYGERFVDLNQYEGLTHANVLEATLELKQGHGLIVPRGYAFWDRSQTYKIRHTGQDVPLDTPMRFNKFGPEINLNTSSMTIRQAKEGFLPIPAMKEAARSMDINNAYRGFGYWGVRSKQHRIMPFLTLVEGPLYYNEHGKEIVVEYLGFDTKQRLPSATRRRKYDIYLRPLPTTNEFNVEWTEVAGDCGCEDSNYMEMRSRLHQDEFVAIRKYGKGEVVMCKHKIGCYEKALEGSEQENKPYVRLSLVPKPKGIMNPWFTWKTKTIVADEDGKRARRPLKTEIKILLGRYIALDPENAFY